MKDMTLKIADLKEYISTDFGKTVIDDGFVYKKAANDFVRINGDFKYIINIWPVAWSSSYSVHFKLRVSQKKIEDILEAIIGKLWHRITFDAEELERIYYSPDGRKVVKGPSLGIWMVSDEDIYTKLQVLKTYYTEIAKPYFASFTTLEAIDDYMNNPPFEYSPAYVGANTNERCMKGLIVAKLVNNPKYEHLVTIYDELIKKTLSEVQPDSIINYNKVKEYLEQHEQLL